MLKTFVSIFVIVNPIGAIPVFLSLAPGAGAPERSRVAARAATAATCVLLASALAGEAALRFFGIGVPSFRVGGGILVLLIAVDMLLARPSRARSTPEESAEAGGREDIAVVPLAVPLLAGPGAISAVILHAEQAGALADRLVLSGAILLVGIVCWVALRLAVPIGARLGATGINVLTRLMGLILAAIAVEFLAAGVRDLLPALAVGAAR